jgi:glycosyltransferase involved in cell wall biosynthesis
MTKKLVLFVNDFLSVLANKGELIERLYNPGNLFEEVHIVLTNNDKPDADYIRKTVGEAKLYIHRLPPPSFKYSFGWQPVFLYEWVNHAVALTKTIQPDLIRCQGFNVHTYLSGKVREATKIPAVVSLHGNPDVDYLRLCKTFRERYYVNRWKKLAESQLHSFDHVIAVYSPIQSYLEQKGISKYSIIYNIVGLGAQIKTDYSHQGPLKCISIGRQTIGQKDPRDIIRAISNLRDVNLYLVGGGDLHINLKDLVSELHLEDRVFLIPSLSNEEIMNTLKDYDVYIYNSINFEISKTVMEAALVGLPIIHNSRVPCLSNELEQLKILKVENSMDGYQMGIQLLLENQTLRKEMGQQSREIARNLWKPEIIEEKIVALYKSLLCRN